VIDGVSMQEQRVQDFVAADVSRLTSPESQSGLTSAATAFGECFAFCSNP
jgi:hypothetical protein